MKRYRHYSKGTAIILSCFGSVIEQEKYLAFEKFIQDSFQEIPVFTAFSSKMVIKELAKKGEVYKNLPQVMADVDMQGYKRYIVVSVNIFPTDEHEVLMRMVKGFREFSLANIRYTNPLLQKTKETSLYLKSLDEQIRKENEDVINLYIIHGVPVLNIGGLEAVSYAADFLKMINENNLACSLEGEFPFYAVKDAIKREILKRSKPDKRAKVQIVPMLLVSGNHYDKDMKEICEEVSEYADATIVPSITQDEKFNLIEQEEVREIFRKNIEIEIKKLGL
ncbi:cobalt chelatase [Sulfurimonas sediminis]|uniref:Cobalt chelatase n=1 Tax=Sulfurimonas sediminis TaxID=2590020 RepID=A0A7M1AYN3_9BACT|nr:sirohydrochlorin cobaltochelatase [Sulfurimonas sediminis]QOP42551.1 cobalt chelatase [Sulfurimonas sediminis]